MRHTIRGTSNTKTIFEIQKKVSYHNQKREFCFKLVIKTETTVQLTTAQDDRGVNRKVQNKTKTNVSVILNHYFCDTLQTLALNVLELS